MKYSNYSVTIVGSGIAGLYAALKLSQKCNPKDGILLLTKSKLGESNSRYAQGGIVGVLKENKNDSTSSHISDTLRAGAGLCDFNAVKHFSEKSDAVIKDLLAYGVEFDRNEKNDITFTLEAAHSTNRVLHAGGDATGRMIEQALVKKVLQNRNIDIYEDSIATELLINSDSECKGLISYNSLTKEHEIIYSSAVILATGGVGQIFSNTTNPLGATGDGIALAYRAGAILQDMEFIQFHPTAFSIQQKGNRFLISEAVRGEGAKLVDDKNVEFMHKYHDKRDLAPRDIVSRAIFKEMSEKNIPNVFLDTTLINAQQLSKRFPTISKVCMENGIDISKTRIPVSPAAHYSIGGIKTNLEGRTSIRGLYALGETASTGLHGANRLASNSLLECVVSAYEIATYLSQATLDSPKQIDVEIKTLIDKYNAELYVNEVDTTQLKADLQKLMWENVGIVRDEKSMEKACIEIDKLKSAFKRSSKCLSINEYEYRNMLTTAKLIAESALKRQESRGAHYRTDFPISKEVSEHNCIIKGKGELIFVK